MWKLNIVIHLNSPMDVYDETAFRGRNTRNPLLARPQVGKTRTTTQDLPGPNFTYGRKDQYDQEGVREVVGRWTEHKAAPAPLPGSDFVKLNRKAALSGCVDASEIAQFRRSTDIKQRSAGPAIDHDALDPFAGMTFGKASRPSTPISGVLSNSYQRDYLLRQREREAHEEAKKVTARSTHIGKFGTSQPTRASMGHRHVPKAEPRSPFKMKRFQDVPSRVSLPRGGPGQTSMPLLPPLNDPSTVAMAAPASTLTSSIARPMQTPEVFVPHGADGPPSRQGYKIVEPPRTQETH